MEKPLKEFTRRGTRFKIGDEEWIVGWSKETVLCAVVQLKD